MRRGPRPAGLERRRGGRLRAHVERRCRRPTSSSTSRPVQFADEGLTPTPEHGFSSRRCVLKPASRGSVRLASADPTAQAAHPPRLLRRAERHGHDDARASRLALEIVPDRAALAPYCETPFAVPRGPRRRRRPARPHPRTTSRPSTTRSAPARSARWSTPSCGCEGVEGLRVVDASVMPTRAARQHQRADDRDRRARRGPDRGPRGARAGGAGGGAGERPAARPRLLPRLRAAGPATSSPASPLPAPFGVVPGCAAYFAMNFSVRSRASSSGRW